MAAPGVNQLKAHLFRHERHENTEKINRYGERL